MSDTSEGRKQTQAPEACGYLYEFFTNHDLEPRSSFVAIANLAVTGIMVRGQPDPDARIINSGAVGFKRRDSIDLLERDNADGSRGDRASKAQKHREMRAKLAELDPMLVQVLRLAYGPQDQVPGLKLGDNAQARAKLDGEGNENENDGRRRQDAHKRRLGTRRQLLPQTRAAQEAHAAFNEKAKRPCTLTSFIVSHATKSQIEAMSDEASAMLKVAWNAWMDLKGRRPSRVQRVEFVRIEEPGAGDFL